MRDEKYQIEIDDTFTLFEFTSVGPKGNIPKIVEFQPTDIYGVYNLAFGDKRPVTGGIDDLIVSNNGDTDRVLTTVVAVLYIFLDNNPTVFVYATGSTPARTRLYRMGINRFYEIAKRDFLLYGRIGENIVEFEIGKDYEGFLVRRKNFKLQI